MATYNIEVIDTQSLDEVTELVARVFVKHEPMSSTKPRDLNKFSKFVRALALEAIAQRTGWMIREDGKVVAALLATDYATSEDVLGVEHIPEDIGEVLERASEIYMQERPEIATQAGQVMHLFTRAVDKRYTGRGMAKMLGKKLTEESRARGYRYLVSECTNAATQRITEKHYGARRVGFVPYTDYPDFKSITEEHKGVAVFELALEQ